MKIDLLENFDIKKSQTRVTSLKSKLESMGDINVTAIKEHEEHTTRFEFISTKT